MGVPHLFDLRRSRRSIELVSLPDHKVVRTLVDNAALRAKLEALKPAPAEFFRVDIGDGVELDGWCIKPPGFDPSKHYPAADPRLRRARRPDGARPLGRAERTSGTGCSPSGAIVVVSVDNRGTPAPRGRAWRKSIYRQIGILASQDQAEARPGAGEALAVRRPEPGRRSGAGAAAAR